MIPQALQHRLVRVGILAALVAAGSPAARAHDVPNRYFDRSLQVTIDADRIRVSYDLSLTQLTLAEELLALVGPGGWNGADPAERWRQYADEMGPRLARGIVLRVDGVELPLVVCGAREQAEQHPRFVFDMAAALPAAARECRELELEDTNFFLEKGQSRIALDVGSAVELLESSVPRELAGVASRASWEMTPEEQDAARRARAVWRPAMEPAERDTPTAAGSAGGDAPRVQAVAAPAAPAASGRARDLVALLDRRSGHLAALMLGLAFFFGAVHALTPGHGKAMVAAYLVGERGTLRHAVGLGLATSLSHTASVLAVAFVLALIGPVLEQKIHRGVSLASGLMVAGLGAWLFLVRLRRSGEWRARAETEHACCVHSGSAGRHADGGGQAASDGPLWGGLLMLGVAGGIVPCWDAVALLLLATAQGQLARACYLLLSFSAGLASVLVAIGVLAVKLRGALGSRLASGPLFRALPVLSAAAILLIGVYLCVATFAPRDGSF